jgi:hypothetical protein
VKASATNLIAAAALIKKDAMELQNSIGISANVQLWLCKPPCQLSNDAGYNAAKQLRLRSQANEIARL